MACGIENISNKSRCQVVSDASRVDNTRASLIKMVEVEVMKSLYYFLIIIHHCLKVNKKNVL